MRNFYLLLICFCAPLSLLGQQEPLYAQYRTNLFVINPAYAGTLSYNELRLNYRSQWRRFPGAPQTLTMSYHGMVDEKNGLGFIAFNDAVGPDTRNGGQFSYAYHLPLGWGGTMGQNYLSLGVGVKLLQYQFRADRVFFADQTDPTIAEVAVPIYLGDASFGAYFHNDNFFAGISAPNLLQSDFSGSIDGSQPNLLSRLYRHYFAIFGYRFVYDNMTIEPNVLIKKVQTSPYQAEGLVKFHLVDEKMFIGVGYRTDWLLTTMFGFKANRLHFIYSADFMPVQRSAAQVYGASHEFTVGIDLNDNWKQFYEGE